VIWLQGVRVRAGGFSLAIDDLSVATGEHLMVLGPTASGKTVLLETVAGLRRPTDGRVWFGDRDVTGEPPERRGAGLVYQDYALFPHLTVAENIAFGLRTPRARGVSGGGSWGATVKRSSSHRRDAVTGGEGRSRVEDRRVSGDREHVRKLADLLGIDGLLTRYPEGLSGGERQRVALARALAIEPEVLLLDEPLSALDGPTRLELQGELKRLQRELGATVMHVTHDLDEALVLGDRMAVIVNGDVRQVGSPQHVTRFPADVEVARLVGLTNVFAVSEMRTDVPGPEGGQSYIRLKNGHMIVAEGASSLRWCDRLFVVIRGEEMELLPDWLAEASVRRGRSEIAGRDNLVDGLIRGVRLQNVHASIDVEVPSVATEEPAWGLTVHMLRSQVEKMGLSVGARTRVRIPSSAVHLCRATAHRETAQPPEEALLRNSPLRR